MRRTALIVRHNRLNASKLATVLVIPLTTNVRWAAAPGNVLLPKRTAGLPRESVVNVSQLACGPDVAGVAAGDGSGADHEFGRRRVAADPGLTKLLRHVTIGTLPIEDIPLGMEGGTSPFAITWQRVQLARHPKRPHTLDYVERLITGFSEIHGDRAYGDDAAIVAGMGFFHEEPVMLLGHQKGRDTKQKLIRNFGMPKPEGYRKALRCMQMASKFKRPILALLDTPGAYPGIDAEERGQAEAIAVSLREMTRLQSPVVSVVIGEGGSGGALAMGVANIVLMMENAIYSVISPESCAAIIWRDAGKAELAANALRLTARDMLELGLIDGIVPEPNGGAQNNWDESAVSLGKSLKASLDRLAGMTPKELVDHRYEKFRKIGSFFEG